MVDATNGGSGRLNWAGPSDFFAMGGYGFYVWGAYGVTLACMLLDPLMAARRHQRALRRVDDDEGRS